MNKPTEGPAINKNSLRELWSYRELVRNLVVKDFKVRYQGSFIGFLWSLIIPLVMITIYIVAFKVVLRIGIQNYEVFLISGLLPWNFFNIAILMATDAVLGNPALVKKVRFPLIALPLSSVLFNFLHLLLALVVFFPVMIALGAPLTPAMVALPLLMLFQVIMTVGLSAFIAGSSVFFQDVRPMTELFLAALFWATPIVYDSQMAPGNIRTLLTLNPMTAIVSGYHDIFYGGMFPSWDVWVAASASAIVIGTLGIAFFQHVSGRFGEEM